MLFKHLMDVVKMNNTILYLKDNYLKILIGRENDKIAISDTFNINNIKTTDAPKIADELCNYFANVGLQFASAIQQSKIIKASL